jgi:hypothetical protein
MCQAVNIKAFLEDIYTNRSVIQEEPDITSFFILCGSGANDSMITHFQKSQMRGFDHPVHAILSQPANIPDRE